MIRTGISLILDRWRTFNIEKEQCISEILSLMGEKEESVSNDSAVKSGVLHDVRESNASVDETTKVNKAFVANRSEKITSDENICPNCKTDTLITLSDMKYCMNDCCTYTSGK